MEETPHLRTFIPAVIVSIILFLGVLLAFQSAKSRPGTIVLPGGITYLGPTPTTPSAPISPRSLTWVTREGTIYPYSFDYPESMRLGVFPNDPTDSVTAFIDGTDANTNIFFRMETLKGKPMDYAQNWWKQYSWKGVSSVTTFTNTNGLKGYRAAYINDNNQTPYDHVFFEVPGRKDLIIWISGKLFSQPDFDTLINSITWKN